MGNRDVVHQGVHMARRARAGPKDLSTNPQAPVIECARCARPSAETASEARSPRSMARGHRYPKAIKGGRQERHCVAAREASACAGERRRELYVYPGARATALRRLVQSNLVLARANGFEFVRFVHGPLIPQCDNIVNWVNFVRTAKWWVRNRGRTRVNSCGR